MIGEPVGFAGQILTRLDRDEVRTTPFALENRPIAGWNQRSQNVPGRDAFVLDSRDHLIRRSQSVGTAPLCSQGSTSVGVRSLIVKSQHAILTFQLQARGPSFPSDPLLPLAGSIGACVQQRDFSDEWDRAIQPTHVVEVH